MRVTRRYNQARRDLCIDLKCESYETVDTKKSAYDDRNYWDNVVPNFKCPKCKKSSNDLSIKSKIIPTKYSTYETV